jgi:hypothetical protein
MAGIQIQRAAHSRLVALSVVDGLARALRTAGEFPPPVGEITCQIVEQLVPVARTFDPPLLLWTVRNRSGYLALDGTYAHDRDRGPRLPLGNGTYRIRVRGDYYQDTDFMLVWPSPGDQPRVPLNGQTPGNVELLPGPAYPLPDVTTGRLQLGPTILRGSLFTSSGDPIAGAVVEAINLPSLQPSDLPPLAISPWPFLKATSSDRGDWAIVLPGRRYIDNTAEVPPANPPPPLRKQITVRVRYPNGTVTDVPNDVELGTEHSVRNTALRGQVVGPGSRPLGGARVETSAGPATSVSRPDGVWFLYFDLNQPSVPNVTVTVTTPDGATASDASGQVRHGATIVVPTFHFS